MRLPMFILGSNSEFLNYIGVTYGFILEENSKCELEQTLIFSHQDLEMLLQEGKITQNTYNKIIEQCKNSGLMSNLTELINHIYYRASEEKMPTEEYNFFMHYCNAHIHINKKGYELSSPPIGSVEHLIEFFVKLNEMVMAPPNKLAILKKVLDENILPIQNKDIVPDVKIDFEEVQEPEVVKVFFVSQKLAH